jgi:hypothetical protein
LGTGSIYRPEKPASHPFAPGQRKNREMSQSASIPSAPHLPIPELRTLIPLEVAAVMLDKNPDEAIALVEDGTLFPAWNIAVHKDGSRSVRVWRDSLLHLMGFLPAGKLPLEKVIEKVLPAHPPGLFPAITSPELQTRFSCSQCHLARLLDAGELKLARPRTGRSRITLDFQSIVNFLMRRNQL